jgi:AGCS family alanine or glycine:cation symporter
LDFSAFIDGLNQRFASPIGRASDLLYGPWTLALLFGTGLYLSVRLRFVQVREFGRAVRGFFATETEGAKGALSPFATFMTALGATIGVGNIAGVATAIVNGGPGALFWIWVYGFFATAVKFTEAVLGVYFRRSGEGQLLAGPMVYLEDGLRLRWLGLTYAFVAGVAALTTTPFTQPNSIAEVLRSTLGVPKLWSGIALAALTLAVVIGGVQSIGRTLERLSPVKVLLYVGGGAAVLLLNAPALPGALAAVFRGAFTGDAAFGGAMGVGIMNAMRYGVARGIYASEAGYGTAAVVYGAARSSDPRQQGLAAVMETFIVAFVTSSISALSIIVTGVWRGGETGAAAVASAFEATVRGGGYVVAVAVLLFGLTSLTGWAYYGEQWLEYLFGRSIVMPYRWIYCGLVVFGATSKVDLVWNWGDLMNGLQIFPNLVGILGLAGVAAKVAAGERPSRAT